MMKMSEDAKKKQVKTDPMRYAAIHLGVGMTSVQNCGLSSTQTEVCALTKTVNRFGQEKMSRRSGVLFSRTDCVVPRAIHRVNLPGPEHIDNDPVLSVAGKFGVRDPAKHLTLGTHQHIKVEDCDKARASAHSIRSVRITERTECLATFPHVLNL